MYAVWASRRRRVIFIHGFTTTGFKISCGRDGDFLVSSTIDASSADVLRLWVKRNIRQSDLVVVDGTNTAVIEAIIFYCCEAKARLIVCTSCHAVKVSSRDQDANPTSGFTMESWQYDEYVDATAKGVFPFPVDKLDEMYYYAGGSIRYMFWPIDRIVTHFDLKIQQVTDARAMLQGRVGDASMAAVNTLMAITKSEATDDIQSTVVSEYATKALRLRSKELDLFLEETREINRYNPVWLGWVTELDVDSRVRALSAGEGLTMWTTLGEEMSFNVRNTACDIPSSGVINPKLIFPGTFFIPKWNYACFDLAYLDFSSSRVTLFQVTEKKSYHSYNLSVMYDFAGKVGATQIEYYIVCRKSHMTEVPHPPAAKILSEWKEWLAAPLEGETENRVFRTLSVGKLIYDEKVIVGERDWLPPENNATPVKSSSNNGEKYVLVYFYNSTNIP